MKEQSLYNSLNATILLIVLIINSRQFFEFNHNNIKNLRRENVQMCFNVSFMSFLCDYMNNHEE